MLTEFLLMKKCLKPEITKKLKFFSKKEGKKIFMKNNIIVHKIKRICTKYI